MIIARTPFRISFAGGGSDLANYYEKFGGAVISTAIDKYIYSVESHRNRDEICYINSKLCGSSHQEADRVCDQRTKVRHRPDAHENQGRQDTPFIQLEEIV